MKKVLVTIAMLVSVISLFFVVGISASAATYGEFIYGVSGGEVMITGCENTISGDIVIPDTIEGYPVTTIEDLAFADCKRITGITIPDTVKSIGMLAFDSCYRLKNVVIPDSVLLIDYCAFGYCTSLERIFIPDSVETLHFWTFLGCEELKTVYFGGTKNEWNAFDCDFDGNVTVYYGHEHNYDVSTIVTATCIKSGIRSYLCECGVSYIEEIPALGHTEEIIAGKSASCTETGLTEGKKCSVCDEILVAQEELSALGHKEEVISGKSATCTEKGITEGKKCSVCGEILVAQKEVAKKAHTPGSWEVVKNAEIGKEGKEQKKCTVCEAVVEERSIAALKEEGKPGDVDGNGKITAADARLALRISAKLEKATEYQTRIADMDKNNKITAADARKILRISAKLE